LPKQFCEAVQLVGGAKIVGRSEVAILRHFDVALHRVRLLLNDVAFYEREFMHW